MNKMQRILFTIYCSFCIVSSYATAEAVRKQVDINSDWKFLKKAIAYEDALTEFQRSGIKKVNLPHTWNTDIVQGKGYYVGLAWYGKTLTIDSSMKQKRLFLRFEGALDLATVYVNGIMLGTHNGGYSAFVYEITDYVKSGENQILISVDNSQSKDVIPGSDILFTRYGGLYRPVWLIVTEPVCITPLDYAGPGVYLKQNHVTDQVAEVEILTKISKTLPEIQTLIVKASLFDPAGKMINEVIQTYESSGEKNIELTQKITIEKPHLWNGRQDPYLYRVKVELFEKRMLQNRLLDVVEQPLGLRYFQVDPSSGFLLNGKPYSLHGVCRHQDWEPLGSALKYENHKTDVDLILEIGATAVRLAHYQQADDMYDLCDQSGLVVWAEIPVIQSFNGFKDENAHQQLIELIRQNYNHPSILFWGIANESPIEVFRLRRLNETAKREDPTRLTTLSCIDPKYQIYSSTDVFGQNCYFGWYYGDTFHLEQSLDGLHQKHPESAIGVSEYGAGGCISHQQQNPDRPNPVGHLFPEQYQSLYHEECWNLISQKDYLWCKFVWNMFDFSWSLVNRGDRPKVNHKGLITWDRKTKKDAFYFYKANWSDEAVLHLTSKRDAIRDKAETEIKVYSNCEEVLLKVNGGLVGRIKQSECANGVFKWPTILLHSGENIIQIEGQKDGRLHKDECVWKLQ
jgi:beta-galactosidase